MIKPQETALFRPPPPTVPTAFSLASRSIAKRQVILRPHCEPSLKEKGLEGGEPRLTSPCPEISTSKTFHKKPRAEINNCPSNVHYDSIPS